MHFPPDAIRFPASGDNERSVRQGTGAGEDGVNDTKKTTSGGNSEWTLSKWNMERGKRPLAPRLQTNVIERLAAVQERREWTEWSDRCVKRWPGTGLVREKCRAVSVSHKATLSQSRQTLQSSRRWNVSHLLFVFMMNCNWLFPWVSVFLKLWVMAWCLSVWNGLKGFSCHSYSLISFAAAFRS